MKYLPTWLKAVFFLSFYPLVIVLHYCIEGAVSGHKDLLDVLFDTAPATGWAGFKESLGDCIFVIVCIPTMLIPVIMCVIIHLYTYVKIAHGCSWHRDVDISNGARNTMIAMLIISACCFLGTFLIFSK